MHTDTRKLKKDYRYSVRILGCPLSFKQWVNQQLREDWHIHEASGWKRRKHWDMPTNIKGLRFGNV